MQEFLEPIWQGIRNTTLWEWIAFVASLGYTYLAGRKSIWCWFFAILGASIYVYLCFIQRLYIDSGLQLFYVGIGVWGWLSWRKNKDERFRVTQKSWRFHGINCGISLLATLTLAWFFERYTNQANPYSDAFVFCFSMVATYLAVEKVLENWIYFILIDLLAIPMFWSRGYQLTAFLYLFYTILAVMAYFSWRKILKQQVA